MLNKLDPIYKEISEELGYDVSIIRNLVESYLNAVRIKISKVKYSKLKSFDNVKTNILIPGFGKFIVKNKYTNKDEHGNNKRKIKWKKYHEDRKKSN